MRVLGSLPWLVACSTSAQVQGEVGQGQDTPAQREVAAGQGEGATGQDLGAVRELAGIVRFTPIEPARRSVEAYLGVEFVLELAAEAVPLRPSEAVSRDQLVAADGQAARVRCTMEAQAVPDPMESYPMGPDGGPLQRPDRCVVSALEVGAR